MPVSAQFVIVVVGEKNATGSATGKPVGFVGRLWLELTEHPHWIHQPEHRPHEVGHPVNWVEPGHDSNLSDLGPHDGLTAISQSPQSAGERLSQNIRGRRVDRRGGQKDQALANLTGRIARVRFATHLPLDGVRDLRFGTEFSDHGTRESNCADVVQPAQNWDNIWNDIDWRSRVEQRQHYNGHDFQKRHGLGLSEESENGRVENSRTSNGAISRPGPRATD